VIVNKACSGQKRAKHALLVFDFNLKWITFLFEDYKLKEVITQNKLFKALIIMCLE